MDVFPQLVKPLKTEKSISVSWIKFTVLINFSHQRLFNKYQRKQLMETIENTTYETATLANDLQDPPVDPRDDENERDGDDDQFPAKEDLQEDDFDLNHDADDDLSLNNDDQEEWN